MRYETLRIESAGPIGRVWLSRPERRNALSLLALEEIAAAFHELQTRFDLSVVVLGGEGVSFCAGADRKDPPVRIFKESGVPPRERRHAAQTGRRTVEAIEQLEAITIARLHGHVIGGGVLLGMACDLRIAAEDTIFQIPEVDLGIPLGWGGAPRLAREVGAARAKELILLCERFDGTTAAQYGLINKAVPPADLDRSVDEWAGRLAEKPPWALHMTKTQFRAYSRTTNLGDVTEGDGDLIALGGSEDPTRFVFSNKERK